MPKQDLRQNYRRLDLDVNPVCFFWLTNTKEVLNFKSMPEIFTADEVAENPSGVADSATRAEQAFANKLQPVGRNRSGLEIFIAAA